MLRNTKRKTIVVCLSLALLGLLALAWSPLLTLIYYRSEPATGVMVYSSDRLNDQTWPLEYAYVSELNGDPRTLPIDLVDVESVNVRGWIRHSRWSSERVTELYHSDSGQLLLHEVEVVEGGIWGAMSDKFRGTIWNTDGAIVQQVWHWPASYGTKTQGPWWWGKNDSEKAAGFFRYREPSPEQAEAIVRKEQFKYRAIGR